MRLTPVGIIKEILTSAVGETIQQYCPDLRIKHSTAFLEKAHFFFPDPMENSSQLLVGST